MDYIHAATTLAEGTYGFYATATLSGKTSPPSRFFLVSVDRTAPTLTVDAPSTTKDYTPEVKVVASDQLDLADGTTVTFDVDTNNDNDFADTGETGFATATLTNGVARKELSVNAVKTVRVRARVTDKAGNEATSTASSVPVQSVSNAWATTGEFRSADPLLGDALLQTGNLHLELPLDLDQSPGTGFALAYNSSRVDVKPLVQTTVQAAQSYSVAPTLTLTLTWNGSAQTPASVTPGGKGEVWTAGVRSSSAVSTTGRYP